MKTSRILGFITASWIIASLALAEGALPTIAEKTQGMERLNGYFDFYWDEAKGELWLEIARFGDEFLYVNSLSSGLGSNPVGLDRGQLGRDRIVKFGRFGSKVLLMEPNQRFRALTDNDLERRAVRESFAESVLWGTTVAAETDHRVLVDFTPFLLSDAHNVIRTLKNSGQGDYSLDPARSAIYRPRTKNFPRNSEFEALLTFRTSASPGPLIRETAPTPEAVTLRQHHSFIRLPDDGYQPRRHDPRAGTISMTFADYATPLDAPLERRYVLRHRLAKKNPSAALSEPPAPIVYYVDSGAPALVQQALIEGASWWNQAFEAAGYRDAFRVEVLPPEADPMDVRYNVIQWVHRSTRGWSYGGSVIDPRTGEILKGHVTLGSLRVRQDRMIFEGINPRFAEGGSPEFPFPSCLAAFSPGMEFLAELDPDANPVDAALARIRQLSAHEVGHTLGFAHNFAASTYAGRASVMDYPAPLVTVDSQGRLDLSQAYAVGIGEWDKITVRYSYGHFPPGSDQDDELETIIQEAIQKSYLFISDADARPAGALHPLANLWDNGTDPVSGLRDLMKVRRAALARFGEGNLAAGEPLALLENTLVPLFLYHRYQVEAAVKMLGGAVFTYARRGDGQKGVDWVSPQDQRDALQAVLETLAPSELTLPAGLLESIPPLPLGYSDSRERFDGHAGRFFDPLGAARVAADMALEGVFQYQRAHRLEAFHSRDPENPGLGEVIDKVFEATWLTPLPSDRWQAATARVIRQAALDHLIELAANLRASHQVRAVAAARLSLWAEHLEESQEAEGESDVAERLYGVSQIRRFLERSAPADGDVSPLSAPPGSPIGSQK